MEILSFRGDFRIESRFQKALSTKIRPESQILGGNFPNLASAGWKFPPIWVKKTLAGRKLPDRKRNVEREEELEASITCEGEMQQSIGKVHSAENKL